MERAQGQLRGSGGEVVEGDRQCDRRDRVRPQHPPNRRLRENATDERGKEQKKEIVYLTNAQWDKLWNILKSYKSLKLEEEPLKDDWKPKNIGKEITDELFNNLSNYSENKFILGHNLKSAQQSNIHIRVNNIVESQLPLTDLLKKGKSNLLWKNKNIGEHERHGKLDANYRPHADLEYDLDHNYISIYPPICED